MAKKTLPQEGMTLSKWRLERKLGEGGMASVWLARHLTLDTLFAIKILNPEMVEKNPNLVSRFLREARLASKLHHRHLVTVSDIGRDRATGFHYLVMEYLPGGNITSRLQKCGPMSEAVALTIVRQVAEALEKAAAHAMVHRDIKPDNIMFDEADEVKLTDLGIAKCEEPADSHLTQTAMVFGTPAYMSPEQAKDSGKVDARADIYSLGVVFYEMLTGRCPYRGNTIGEILVRILEKTPPPDVRTLRPEISEETAELIRCMMAKEAEDRPASATMLIQNLKRLEAVFGVAAAATDTALPTPGADAPGAESMTLPTQAACDVTLPTQAACGKTYPAQSDRTVASDVPAGRPPDEIPLDADETPPSPRRRLLTAAGIVVLLFLVGAIALKACSQQEPAQPAARKQPPVTAPRQPEAVRRVQPQPAGPVKPAHSVRKVEAPAQTAVRVVLQDEYGFDISHARVRIGNQTFTSAPYTVQLRDGETVAVTVFAGKTNSYCWDEQHFPACSAGADGGIAVRLKTKPVQPVVLPEAAALTPEVPVQPVAPREPVPSQPPVAPEVSPAAESPAVPVQPAAPSPMTVQVMLQDERGATVRGARIRVGSQLFEKAPYEVTLRKGSPVTVTVFAGETELYRWEKQIFSKTVADESGILFIDLVTTPVPYDRLYIRDWDGNLLRRVSGWMDDGLTPKYFYDKSPDELKDWLENTNARTLSYELWIKSSFGEARFDFAEGTFPEKMLLDLKSGRRLEYRSEDVKQ